METTHHPCARFESEARLEDGHLVIRLSIETLAHAARHSDYFFQANNHGTQLLITDEASFAKAVQRALNREAEDGSTPITRMLDAATRHVADQGDDGIEVAPTLWAIHMPGPHEYHAAPQQGSGRTHGRDAHQGNARVPRQEQAHLGP